MTELEDRLHDLATPSDARPAAPSLQRLELEAAARHHRHRSARVLAAAAVVVVVAALAVAIVRHPQPTSVDTLGGPGATSTQPTASPNMDGLCLVKPDAPAVPPPDTIDWNCVQQPADVIWLGFSVDANVDPQVLDDTMTTLRQRLDALGETDAKVTYADGQITVMFAPGHDLHDVAALRLLGEGTQANLLWVMASGTSDTQP